MENPIRKFADRAAAGKELAARIEALKPDDPVVYALPRGGVPVGLEIALQFGVPLDLIMVRKFGAPGAPEVALGAVVDGASPLTVVNEDVRRASGADEHYLKYARDTELEELERRRACYLGDREPIDPTGRTAILVDDGLATGATMKAAIMAMKQQEPRAICVAVPVAPRQTIEEIGLVADTVVCLHTADRFFGVGAYYDDFHQMTDREILGLLKQG
ncbi:phosphoribosyltransferase [Pararhizobium haloflavum]|uniref:phosphoribosyltransferase n=1 Tax=Pararhizobium haloflavum TaxID=2037914 RepID=UPI000C18A22B|nr:phosphoribosyltransferase family protein [Pararhizobium haloflavum]